MARLAFSYNDWTEHFDGRDGIQNPNSVLYDTYGFSAFGQTILTDAVKDGGQLAYFGIGSGKTYWINAKYQMNLSALYQLPAGFEIAGNLFARQGYPRVTTIDFETGLGTFSGIATPGIDAVRTPDVWNFDLRLAKNFRLSRGRYAQPDRGPLQRVQRQHRARAHRQRRWRFQRDQRDPGPAHRPLRSASGLLASSSRFVGTAPGSFGPGAAFSTGIATHP